MAASVRITPVPARKRRRVMLELATIGRFNLIRRLLVLGFIAGLSEQRFHNVQVRLSRLKPSKNQIVCVVKSARNLEHDDG